MKNIIGNANLIEIPKTEESKMSKVFRKSVPLPKYEWKKEKELFSLFGIDIPENITVEALKTNVDLDKLRDLLIPGLNVLPNDNELEKRSDEFIDTTYKYSKILQMKRKNYLWDFFSHNHDHSNFKQFSNNKLCEKISKQLNECTIKMKISFKDDYIKHKHYPSNMEHINKIVKKSRKNGKSS